ncbi:MAG: VWA domain-containing protein, partial [Myxococcales bacterium]|nr:VWA domain-containing protein [Myxococcales bacterium]
TPSAAAPPPVARDAGAPLCDGPGCEDPLFECGSLRIEPRIEVASGEGNVLLIYDRSGSMGSDWAGGPRWETARDAVADALEALPAAPTMAGLFFPADGSTCEVGAVDGVDQLDFTDRAGFVSALRGTGGSDGPSAARVGGLSPLLQALARADSLLEARPAGRTRVYILTDGMPDCGWDDNEAMRLLAQWQRAGIETHAILLPGAEDATITFSGLVGSSGGRVSFIDDPERLRITLEERIPEVLSSAGLTSCTLGLDLEIPEPDALHLVVEQQGSAFVVARELAGGGWTVSNDGLSAQLTGTLCDAAMAGDFQTLYFELGCVDLPPLQL